MAEPLTEAQLRLALLDPSTKTRQTVLERLAEQISSPEPLSETAPGSSPDLAQLLSTVLALYPHFQDKSSRQWTTQLISRAATQPWFADAAADFAAAASAVPAVSRSDCLLLIQWTGEFLLHSAASASASTSGSHATLGPLIDSLSHLLDLLQRSERPERPELAGSRAAASAIAATLSKYPDSLQTFLDRLSPSLAGPLVEAVLRLQASAPTLWPQVEEARDRFVQLYVSSVVNAKAILPGHVRSFAIVLRHIITESDFKATIGPQLDKALLRAPEVVLGLATETLFTELPPCDLMSCRTFAVLVGCLKSSKETVRAAAAETLRLYLLRHCTPDSDLGPITTELVAPLKSGKITGSEQKHRFTQVLGFLPPCAASARGAAQLATAVAAVAAKETNEAILLPVAQALLRLPFDAAAVQRGLSDSRPHLQKAWAMAVWLMPDPAARQALAVQFAAPLKAIFDSVSSNPLAAAQSRLLPAAYAAYVVAPAEARAEMEAQLLSSESSPLLHSKAYSKLVGTDDQRVFLHALVAASPAAVAQSSVAHFADAWIWVLTSTSVTHAVAQEAKTQVAALYTQVGAAGFGSALLDAVYRAYAAPLADVQAAHVLKRFNFVLAMLAAPADGPEAREAAEKDVAAALLACHLPGVSVKSGWAAVCQTARLDPSELLAAKSGTVVAQLSEQLLNPDCGVLVDAAKAAIGTTSFIAPSAVVPAFAELLEADLAVEPLNSLTPEDLVVWRTPEGELAFDPTEAAPPAPPDRGATDAETRKWEEALRAELARKKAAAGRVAQRKLSKEQVAQQKVQREKEAQSRAATRELWAKCSRGVSIVEALAKEAALADNGAEMWLPVAQQKLLAALEAGVDRLVGSAAASAFLSITTRTLEARLGSTRRLVGVAILRMRHISEPTESSDATVNIAKPQAEPQAEPLSSLLSRVLYKIRVQAESRPFDEPSLLYLLPLLTHPLNTAGASKTPETESEAEQVLLALDVVAQHADGVAASSVARAAVLPALLHLLAVPSHSKAARDCFLVLCRSFGPELPQKDLQVLFAGLVAQSRAVQSAVLEGIDAELDISACGYVSEVYVARFSSDEAVAELAADVWVENSLHLVPEAPRLLAEFLGSESADVRAAAAAAVAAARAELGSDAEPVSELFSHLLALFRSHAPQQGPQLDENGMAIKGSKVARDPWEWRHGVALTVAQLSSQVDTSEIVAFLEFALTEKNIADPVPAVREALQSAAVALVADSGAEAREAAVPVLESALKAPETDVKVAAIIVYGTLARKLPPGDPRTARVVAQLLATLDTPSRHVQHAAGDCLAALVPLFTDSVAEHLNTMLEKVWHGPTAASRHGAAVGVAGLVKGAGLGSVAQHGVLDAVLTAAEDRRDPRRREGAQLVLQELSRALGPFFEPYALQALPTLLAALGDAAPEVRKAATLTTRSVMRHMTGYGVAQLIPVALDNLEQPAWRAKKGAVQMLGSTAFLDPRQLSASLATVVPQIVAVLGDSHKEVRAAATAALQSFGEVIRNPEIQKLVPTLVSAISDPANNTEAALKALTATQFAHYIDAPSLALVVYVVERGLRSRAPAVRRLACQVVGNLALLVDGRDLVPYLPGLVGGLQECIAEAVASTTGTAARALGLLVQKAGEAQFPGLVDSLIATLKDPSRAGDRLGAGQALAEVIGGLGVPRLESVLPEIVASCTSSEPHVRQAFLPLLMYLPACFGAAFTPFLGKVLSPVLAGLADPVPEVRDTALRAGRFLVRRYASRAVELVLPELERGLGDASGRIRLACLELVGELLFQVGGVEGAEGEAGAEKEGGAATAVTTSSAQRVLADVLGSERRNRILAELFVCRADTFGQVRLAAGDIWKLLVSNTPRTVREILPELTALLVRRLAAPEEETRTIAAQALGEIVRRVGDALGELLPTLQRALPAADPDAKCGICVAVAELVRSAPDAQIETHEAQLLAVVRETLVDASGAVRGAAAVTFDALQERLGDAVVAQVVPELLELLEAQHEWALLALQEILAARADSVLPLLLPRLLAPPIDVARATALGSLAAVAGDSLDRRLSAVVNGLVDAQLNASATGDATLEAAADAALDKTLAAVSAPQSVHSVLGLVLGLLKSENAGKRGVMFRHAAAFFAETKLGYAEAGYLGDIVTVCVLGLAEADDATAGAAWKALAAVAQRVPKDRLESLVRPVASALPLAGPAGEELPGFRVAGGVTCVVPIFVQGLLVGSTETRVIAAEGLAATIKRAAPPRLRPAIPAIAGPLIRTVGERVPPAVKTAIVETLRVLFSAVAQFLKPFMPQLQRTFVKAVADPSDESLRRAAAAALGELVRHTPRVDPLVTELVSGVRSSSDGVRESQLAALLAVVENGGAALSHAAKLQVLELVESEAEAGAGLGVAHAKLLGTLAGVLTFPEAATVVQERIVAAGADGFAIMAVNSFLRHAPGHLLQPGLVAGVVRCVVAAVASRDAYVSDNGILAVGKMLCVRRGAEEAQSESDEASEAQPVAFTHLSSEEVAQLIDSLAEATEKPASNSPDTRRLALVVIRTAARQNPASFRPYWDILGPAVFTCVRETIIPIKLAAEKAFLALFRLVEDEEMTEFKQWVEKISQENPGGTLTTATGRSIPLRSLREYTTRVGARLAAVEKERMAAGGDAEAMFSDEFEDEREVWSVGGVELGN